ncbi:MAG: delta-60 repeat domain-containing protein [Candidatus Babeliales bacterium]
MIRLLATIVLIVNYAAYASDGTLDLSFSGGQGYADYAPPGIMQTDTSTIAIQSDGKIVTTPIDAQNSSQVCIARFNPDGDPDLPFGQTNTGMVRTSVYASDWNGLLIQPDGKILVCGNTADRSQALIQRFNPNGSIDTSFGTGNGVAIFDGTGSNTVWFNAVILQADGSIVATGSLNGTLLTARFTVNGILDRQFDPVATITEGYALTVQADGKVVVAADAVLVRYNPSGSVDNSFGDGGVASASTFAQGLFSVALQTDGAIVAAGTGINNSFLISRFTALGLLDFSYNTVGYNSIVPGSLGGTYSVAMQSDSKAILCGTNSNGQFFQIIRYNTHGVVDNSFGPNGNGIVQVPLGFAVALALQPDGKLAAAGNDPSNALIRIARYLNSPSLASTTMNLPRQNQTIGANVPYSMSGQAQDPACVYVLVDGKWTQPGAHTDPGNWVVPITINTVGRHTVQAVALYQDGNVNISGPIVNVTVGPVPPITFTGIVTKNEFVNKTEYVLQATFTPSSAVNVTTYAIYQNNILLATIPATDPLTFVFCGKSAHAFNGIGVAAVSNGIAGPQTPLVIE